jgi:hypothetical protein
MRRTGSLGGLALVFLLCLFGSTAAFDFGVNPPPGGNNVQVVPWDDPSTYTVPFKSKELHGIVDADFGDREITLEEVCRRKTEHFAYFIECFKKFAVIKWGEE